MKCWLGLANCRRALEPKLFDSVPKQALTEGEAVAMTTDMLTLLSHASRRWWSSSCGARF